MTTNIKDNTIIKVYERQEVTYKTHKFLIFTWFTKLYAEKLGTDIVIQTNLFVDDVYLNGNKIN